MPKNWNKLSLPERAEDILRNVGGLTDEDKAQIYEEWSRYTFTPDGFGQIRAEAELQRIATEYALKRSGKWKQELQRRDDLMQRMKL